MEDTSTLRIASLNVNDVIDRNRFRLFVTQMRNEGIAVLTLQNTHVDNELADRLRNDFELQMNILSAVADEKLAGIMILVNKRLTEFDATDEKLQAMNDWEDVEERVLVTPIRMERKCFTVKCVYAPPTEQARLTFSNEVLRAGDAGSGNRPSCDFLCGDWNMKLTRADSNSNRASTIRNLTTHRACLSALMDSESFTDEWRQYHPKLKKYTHANTTLTHASDRSESRIDRIYMRKDWYMQTRDWDIVPTRHIDHDSVQMIWQPSNPLFEQGRKRITAAMMEFRMTLNACRAEIFQFNSVCEELFVKTEENQKSPLSRQDECELILRVWRQVKQRCLEIMFRKKRALNWRVKSKKYTLRKQYQAGHRDPENREALRAELNTMKKAKRIDFTHNEFVKDYILKEISLPAFYNSVKTRNKTIVITQLQNETTDEITCEVNKMLAIIRRFYKNLYSPKDLNKDARNQLLRSLTRKLSRNVKTDCILPISASKIVNELEKKKLSRFSNEDDCSLNLWHKLML